MIENLLEDVMSNEELQEFLMALGVLVKELLI